VRRVPIDKAEPGQILAEKLTRHDGVLLAGQGSEVTEGLLRMLGRLNVETIVIEEEESRTAEEVLTEYRRFRDELDARFVRVDDQPVLQALKRTLIYLAEKERDETLAVIDNPAADEAGSETKPSPSQPNSSPDADAASDPR
jgi:hypothetical protein